MNIYTTKENFMHQPQEVCEHCGLGPSECKCEYCEICGEAYFNGCMCDELEYNSEADEYWESYN